MTDCPDPAAVGLTLVHQGKVREVYDAGEGHLLLVASDRLSAFDVVMAEPVPDKGRILTALSWWWSGRLEGVAPTHLVSVDVADLPAPARDLTGLVGRVALVRRAEMVPIECIVRGYLAGSAWAEYAEAGTVHGESLPGGLREAERFDTARFTPSTKGAPGEHDRNLSFDEAVAMVGGEVAEACRALSLAVYDRLAASTEAAGLLLADTKLELGFVDGELVVADEIGTPDSSRFWEASAWEPGTTPVMYDKQPVRDHLAATGWDRRPPPPALPDSVVVATRERYLTAYERITGLRLADWPPAGSSRASIGR